jgi:hypothetical protein
VTASAQATSLATSLAAGLAVGPVVGLAMLLAGPGCGARVESRAETGDPTILVREYFAAIAVSDCDRVRATLTGNALDHFETAGCRKVLDDYLEHGAQLLRVEGTGPDGRDPARRLISVQIRKGSGEQTIVVGVRGQGGTWKIEQI